MGFKQVTNFDLNKMGTAPGLCLQNVRLGYGIPPKYASARDAMNACKARGTFHEGLADCPTDVDVPIFAETGSPYAHVMVDVHGNVYSDGKYLPSFAGMTIIGWSEELNDVRVVEKVAEPEPTPEPTPEPDNKVYYTYVQGDTFGAVLKKLGLDEGNLWGVNGTVNYYTDQLWNTQPNVFDARGNIKIGVEFYLIPRK